MASHSRSRAVWRRPDPAPDDLLRMQRRARRRRWWITFGLQSAFIVCWSVATPLSAAPDESAHIIKAAAVVRGELLGTPVAGPHHTVSGFTVVEVPGVFNALSHACYAFHPDVSAACIHVLPHSSHDVAAATGAGRYPPLYYAVVGLPSLVFKSIKGIRLMRIFSALFCSVFLASALMSAAEARRRRLLVWAVAIATTPMAIFLAGVVNPNALEIAAAICLWTSGVVLATEDDTPVDRRMLARAGISAAVLVQVRPISPLWFRLIAAALAVVAGRARLVQILHDRVAWIWGAVVGASGVFALAWLEYAHALASSQLPPKPLSFFQRLEGAVGLTEPLLHEMVGVLGWLDTPVPPLTFYPWLAVVAVLAGIGLLTAQRRRAWTLLALTAAVVVLPIVIQVRDYTQVGSFFWQGRYTLPIAVGVVILGAGIADIERLPRFALTRVTVLVAPVFAIGHLAMWLQALRRYTVGLQGPLNPFGGQWHPPFGSAELTIIFVAVLALWTAWLAAIANRGLMPWRRSQPLPPDRSVVTADSDFGDGTTPATATSATAAPSLEPTA